MSKIAHLLEMLITLQHKKLTTASELADVLEVDKKTIYRYINNLNKADIPVYTKKGRYGGFYIDKEFYMKPPKLTAEEFQALLAAEDILNKNGFPHERELRNAISKIKSVSINDDKLLKNIENGVGFRINSIGNDVKLDDKIKNINYSMERGRSLKISYYSFYKNILNTELIDPYTLIFKNGQWHIVSYCHKDDMVKSFTMSRIKNVEITNDIYIKPRTFSLNEFLKNHWGVFNDGKILVKIKFDNSLSNLIENVQWTINQQVERTEQGEIILKLYLDSLDEIKEWVMGFGVSAEVIEPASLRDEITREIKRLSDIYK
ncbi:helix-turn-helix transcriptional regulator [Clostridium rectalis]|uniref:helix-turn-helix transcriptional regulator n=1 Tax=Clostridium rectalis TaxID=2040295 RepID=UPI000F63E8F9|nr:WYL domain-containing protein [Clostridium rectalis]